MSMGLTGLLLALGVGVLLAALDGAGARVGETPHPAPRPPGESSPGRPVAADPRPRPDRPESPALRTRVVAVTLALAGAAALLVAGRGLQIAWDRSVQDAFLPETRFDRPIEADGLRGLLWGRPTLVEPPSPESTAPGQAARDQLTVQVSADDLEALLATLGARDGGLFVFPDWTVLYGLTGRRAPGPLVWFHRGLTYTEADASEIDRLLVHSLDRHEVRTVVLERVSWRGTDRRLDDFPRLRALLAACYRPVETIGIFEVLARRAACPRPGPPARPAPSNRFDRSDPSDRSDRT